MKSLSPLRILSGIVTLLVVAAVVVGLFLAGSPGAERDRQFDAQRVGHLEQLSYAVDAYFERRGELPGELSMLANEQYFFGSLVDPQTSVPYEYRITGATMYELCANFALYSDPTANPNAAFTGRRPMNPYPIESPGKPQSWFHGAGRACFSLEVRPSAPGIVCGLLKPCAAGQTCAVLPDATDAVCVPEGRECLAAGCANNQCVIAESYPVQVRCTQ